MKYYKSKTWLHRRLYRDRKTVAQIASECGVSKITIYKQIKEFGFDK